MIDRVEHDGGVLELRLNRPPANALSPDLIDALHRAVEGAPAAGARAVVLSGRPGMFSAGLDVPTLLQLDRAAIGETWKGLYAALHALASSPIPVAAAITGHSPAGGAVLALYCDVRVMAQAAPGEKDFRIGLNEVQVGLPMPPVIFRALAQAVGNHRASLLAGGGLLVTSAEAHRLGFVDEILPTDQVVDRAVAWCRERLALPPGAHDFTRGLGRKRLLEVFDGADDEIAGLVEGWFAAETQGAMRALVERLKKK
jgi:3,2-trans-enoyl-CoA isomerase